MADPDVQALLRNALPIQAASVAPTTHGRIPVALLDTRTHVAVRALLLDQAHPPTIERQDWYHLGATGQLQHSLLVVTCDRLTFAVRFDWPGAALFLRSVAALRQLGLLARAGRKNPVLILTIMPDQNGLLAALQEYDHGHA